MTDFERGAEAMREACATLAHESDKNGGDYFGPLRAKQIRDAIRLLPLPVQPPGSESRETRLESENTRLSAELAALKDGVRGHQRAALEAENTRLKEKLAAVDSIPERVHLETLLDCISDVATGRRPPEDFMPAEGVLAEVIAALVAGGAPASDKQPLRPPDARPPSPEKQRGDKT